MAVAIEKFVELIESVAPKELALDWDNSGLLIKCKETINSVLITLDVTPEIMKEAVERGCDMILSHHPLIFSAMKKIDNDDCTGALVMEFIRNGISLYCAHTSFDRARGGMGDALAEKLGLCDTKAPQGSEDDYMRVGKLKESLSGKEFAEVVKQRLECSILKVSDENFGAVENVAVAGGSGGELLAQAKKMGAEALVTGEAKHHQYLEARGLEILLIEAGHFETEQLFAKQIFSSLQSRLNEVQLHLDLKTAKHVSAPYSIV